MGRELLELAEQQDDAALQVEGYLVLGSSLAFKGEIAAGLAELERGIALFGPDQSTGPVLCAWAELGRLLVHDRGLLLWLLGIPTARRTERRRPSRSRSS